MLLTRESDYAIRVIRALKSGEKQAVKYVCVEEDIPEPFTYKILKKLERAGIVRSVRGAQGGYYLDMELSELSLYDIVIAIDPQFSITQCTVKDCSCSRHQRLQPCTVHEELERIQSLIVKELKGKTLSELLGRKTST